MIHRCKRNIRLSLVSISIISVICFISKGSWTGVVRQSQRVYDLFKLERQSSASNVFIPHFINETDSKKPPSIPRTFPIEEEDFCKRRPDLDYIVYIYSAISHIKSRNDTRMTWANSATAAKLGVKLASVFIVGRPKNPEEELILKSESDTYHDIVQGDFADSYDLLVYKGLAGMEWLTRHCSHVPWTIHADDDVIVDIILVDKALKKRGVNAKDEFICHCIKHNPVMRTGKWAVPVESYREKMYPDYCSGTFWILQTRNIQSLLNATQYVNFIWIDDAYQTGLVAQKAGRIRYTWFPDYKIYMFEHFQESHIGDTIVWYEQRGSHRANWEKILAYYRRNVTG